MGLRRKIKKFLYNLKYPNNKFIIDLNKKKVLVTGSNSGIGLSLVKQILEQIIKYLQLIEKNLIN